MNDLLPGSLGSDQDCQKAFRAAGLCLRAEIGSAAKQCLTRSCFHTQCRSDSPPLKPPGRYERSKDVSQRGSFAATFDRFGFDHRKAKRHPRHRGLRLSLCRDRGRALWVGQLISYQLPDARALQGLLVCQVKTCSQSTHRFLFSFFAGKNRGRSGAMTVVMTCVGTCVFRCATAEIHEGPSGWLPAFEGERQMTSWRETFQRTIENHWIYRRPS